MTEPAWQAEPVDAATPGDHHGEFHCDRSPFPVSVFLSACSGSGIRRRAIFVGNISGVASSILAGKGGTMHREEEIDLVRKAKEGDKGR